MKLPDYKPTKLVCGMTPWMFWTLLSVVLFTLFGPFIAVLFR